MGKRKPINETIGSCPCSSKDCDEKTDVRRQRDNMLYLVCPECGVIRHRGKALQEWILSNANLHGARIEPEPGAGENEPGPEPGRPDEKKKNEKASMWAGW